ncbi:MAG: hypothetical protein RSE41_09730 [Clostridia bacterium]
MEKNNPFFDPYNFNMNNNQPMQTPDLDVMQNNQIVYYESQYMYYKYLTQMLDYKMKLKEFEKCKDIK